MFQLANKHFLWLSTLLFLFLSLNRAFSQLNYSLTFDHQYNSNPFRLPETEASADHISQFAAGLRNNWEKISLQYFGNYARFRENSLRNFYWQQLYFTGGDSTNWFVSAENRINRQEYNLYDYFTLQAGLNHVFYSGNFLMRLGSNLSINTFRQLEELNNFTFNGYFSLNRSFQTRTSFFGTLSFNYKTYLNQPLIPVVTGDTLSGMNLSVSSIDGMGGRGKGFGTNPYYLPESETPSLGQMVLSFRVAQSLAKFTGVALQYTNRFSFSSQDRSIVGLIDGFSEESQIFDDPMGYQGQTVGLEFTQIFPWRLLLKTSGYWQSKNYISQGIYLDAENFTEERLRKDTYKTLWFSLRKTWDLNFNTFGALTFQLNYQWIDNQSNSYWYDYQNNYFSTGIGFDF